MYTIKSPNPQYNDVSVGVQFTNGQGATDDAKKIEWFESHGYTVEQSDEGVTATTYDENAPTSASTYHSSGVTAIPFAEAQNHDTEFAAETASVTNEVNAAINAPVSFADASNDAEFANELAVNSAYASQLSSEDNETSSAKASRTKHNK